jgi:putative phosphoribosyl transferase
VDWRWGAPSPTRPAPLDVVVTQQIGAPGNPDYAITAVASDGSVSIPTPRSFRDVGQFYEWFDRMSDGEAMTYLDRES